MLQTLLNFFGSGILKEIGEQLNKAYEVKLNAETDQAKIEADSLINQLQTQQVLLVAEQKRWFTAWVRPALAFPVVVLVNKLIIWDTVLGWGVTPYPGDFVAWLVTTIVAAYMLTRPFERR